MREFNELTIQEILELEELFDYSLKRESFYKDRVIHEVRSYEDSIRITSECSNGSYNHFNHVHFIYKNNLSDPQKEYLNKIGVNYG